MDVAIINGGGIRADLPEGALTYGTLYEAFPFDNRFAVVELTASRFARVLARNLRHDGGILSIAGLHALARCEEPCSAPGPAGTPAPRGGRARPGARGPRAAPRRPP